MKLALGMDHRGVELARALGEHLPSTGHEIELFGQECADEPCDYPDIAYQVAEAVRKRDADRGILICGTGIGACIAANKVAGIRAALVHDEVTAELSRRHNDACVLCLSGDELSPPLACRIVDTWLVSPFDGGRHERRVNKITAIERGENPAELAC